MHVHQSPCDWNEEFQRRTFFLGDDESVGYTDFVPNPEYVKAVSGGSSNRRLTPLYWTVAGIALVAVAASILVVVSVP